MKPILAKAEPLIAAGEAVTAPVLKLTAPLSFWGGVDPATGRIIQVRHPECGQTIGGQILALPGTIGSSSSSAVLLELIRLQIAPAALLLHEPDAILLIGCVIGNEMGWLAPPAFRLTGPEQSKLPFGSVTIAPDGSITS
ncbi:MAG: aconitase X swivel domain-containing protein [Rhabdaerophilum sp.]